MSKNKKKILVKKESSKTTYFLWVFWLVAFVLLYFVLANDSTINVSNHQTPVSQFTNATEDSISLAARKIIYENYFITAEHIADTTKNLQAKSIIAFLKENAAVSRFREGGLQILEQKETARPQPVIIILANEPMSGDLQRQANLGAAAFFDYRISALVIREQKSISKLSQALLLLHEGNHALNFRDYPYDPFNFNLRVVDEYKTYSFINDLLSKLGGKGYQEALEERIEILKKHRDSLKLPENALQLLTDLGYNKKLDLVFGKAETQAEKDTRQTWADIHAIFIFYERDDSRTAEARKYAIIRFMYKLLLNFKE